MASAPCASAPSCSTNGWEREVQKDILRRDVKPPNLLFNSNGQAKIADFGSAKWLQQEEDHASTTLGTKLYMAPERFFGDYAFDADEGLWRYLLMNLRMALMHLRLVSRTTNFGSR